MQSGLAAVQRFQSKFHRHVDIRNAIWTVTFTSDGTSLIPTPTGNREVRDMFQCQLEGPMPNRAMMIRRNRIALKLLPS